MLSLIFIRVQSWTRRFEVYAAALTGAKMEVYIGFLSGVSQADKKYQPAFELYKNTLKMKWLNKMKRKQNLY